ncbi:ankyrin repeat-containing domain protein, partial [Phyllosticta citriasiana]
DRDGNTALGLAVTLGNYNIVKLLLDSGAPANGFDQRRRTPLMWAALWGHYRIAQLLMDHGAYNGFEDIDGFTAIDLA